MYVNDVLVGMKGGWWEGKGVGWGKSCTEM